MGFIVAPVVDAIHISHVPEIHVLHLCLVEILHLLLIGLGNGSDVVVHENAVGNL